MFQKIHRDALWGVAALPVALSMLGLLLASFSRQGLAWWSNLGIADFRGAGLLGLLLVIYVFSFSLAMFNGMRKHEMTDKWLIAAPRLIILLFCGIILAIFWPFIRNSSQDNIGLVSIERVRMVEDRMEVARANSPYAAKSIVNVVLIEHVRSGEPEKINIAYRQTQDGAFREKYERLLKCLAIIGLDESVLARKITRQGWASADDLRNLKLYARSAAANQMVSSKWTVLQQNAFLVISGEQSLDDKINLSGVDVKQ